MKMKKLIILMAVLCFLTSQVSAEWITPGFEVKEITSYTTSTDINSALGTGDFYKYTHNISNPLYEYSAFFKEKSSNTRKNPSAILRGDYLVTQSPQDLKLGDSNIGKILSDEYVIDGGKITYPNQWGAGIDLVYEYNAHDLKETVVIDAFTTLPSSSSGDMLTFTQKIRAYNYTDQDRAMRQKIDGVSVLEDTVTNLSTEVLTLRGHEDEIVWTMKQPIAYDGEGDTIVLNYTLHVNLHGNLVVDVYVPYDWLQTATYPVSVDPSWASPDNVISDSTDDPGSSGSSTNFIDGDTNTKWAEAGVGFGEQAAELSSSYDWFITVNLTTPQNISKVQIFADGNEWPEASPCKLSVVKICDDALCSGESDLITSDCVFALTRKWQECNLTTATKGSYIFLAGGVWDETNCVSIDNDIRTNRIYELQVYIIDDAVAGDACTSDSECSSGYCTDDVCCNNACSGTCVSCDLPAALGTCTNIQVDTDPDGECAGTECRTGNCDGSGACKVFSDDSAGACGSCEYCSSAADPECNIVPSGQDPNSDCTGLDCDGGVTKYYFGWDAQVCYYNDDVSSADHYCDGSSTCRAESVSCPVEPQGASTGVSCLCEEAEVACTSTTVGQCSNELCVFAPEALGVYITPSTPDSVDELTCEYTYYDANADVEDTDALLIFWYINGTEFATVRNMTIVDNSYLYDGDVWFCNVSVNDGTLYSNWTASTEVSIGKIKTELREPIGGYSTSHNTEVLFKAFHTAPAGKTIENGTLVVWNSSDEIYIEYTNITVGSPNTAFLKYGVHTLAEDTYTWALNMCDDTDSCIMTSNFSLTSTNSTPVVVLISPSNNSVKADEQTFYCSVTALGDELVNTTLTIVNDTTTIALEVDTTSTLGYKSFTPTLPNDEYTWSCVSCDADNDCTSSGTYSFILTELTTGTGDTGGACLTEYGYYTTYTAASDEDYILVNTSLLNGEGYISTIKAENVWIEGATGYYHSTYNILVDTISPTNKIFNIWIASGNFNKTKADLATAPDVVYTPTISEFTLENNAYIVNILNESGGEALEIGDDQHALTVKVICDSYSPDTIDVKGLGVDTFFIATKEIPTIWLAATYTDVGYTSTVVREIVGYNSTSQGLEDNISIGESYNIWQNTTVTTYGNITEVVDHKYKVEDTSGEINMYMIQNNTEFVTTDFVLQDYTSQAAGSYLEILRNVNGSLEKVWRTPWSTFNFQYSIEGVDLQNNTDYQVLVVMPGLTTHNLGWFVPSETGIKRLVITQPSFSDYNNHYEGIQYQFLSDPVNNIVGFVYNITDARVTNITMNYTVRNETHLVYSGYATTIAGSFSYTLPTENASYYVKFDAQVPYHSYLFAGETFNPQGLTTFKMRDAFDLEKIFGVGGTFLGSELPSVRVSIMYVSMMFVALLAGAANWTIMLGVLGLVFGFFYIVGWIDEYAPLIVLTFVIAAIGRFVLARDKEGGN